MDGGAATVVQFHMAGHQVGEEHVADLGAERPGVGPVLLDVALLIGDDGGRTSFVSD